MHIPQSTSRKEPLTGDVDHVCGMHNTMVIPAFDETIAWGSYRKTQEMLKVPTQSRQTYLQTVLQDSSHVTVNLSGVVILAYVIIMGTKAILPPRRGESRHRETEGPPMGRAPDDVGLWSCVKHVEDSMIERIEALK